MSLVTETMSNVANPSPRPWQGNIVWRTKNKPVLLMLCAACDGHYGNENWEFNADVEAPTNCQYQRSDDLYFSDIEPALTNVRFQG